MWSHIFSNIFLALKLCKFSLASVFSKFLYISLPDFVVVCCFIAHLLLYLAKQSFQVRCKHLKILGCDDLSVSKEVTMKYAAVSFQAYLDPTSWCLKRMVWEVLVCCSRQTPLGSLEGRCAGPPYAACTRGWWWGVASV